MKTKLFVSGDLDGFFGLFIDNLLQLMLIATLGKIVCGFPFEFITHKILPGAALSILAGNLFYSWQAYKLAKATNREDVTALPYGINTVSLIAFILLVMGPVYQRTQNLTLTWQVGLFACFVSGVLETLGALLGTWVRKHTPRAALLSSLAGVAITFIAMGFVFQIFANPILSLLPLFIILLAYSSGFRLPLGIPGGFAAAVIGCALAWILKSLGYSYFQPLQESYQFGIHLPQLSLFPLWDFLKQGEGWQYMSVIFPMALFNLVGSLQNLESAEAAGDSYPTEPCLLANGFCSIIAACLGSPFPTTIYIGHPGWKAMGARTGYSLLNGAVISLLCLVGGVTLILKIVPLDVTLGILLWIGLVMSAQAFQEVPRKHALAVALGVIPSLAAWALFLIETTLLKNGISLWTAFSKFGNEIYISGIFALNQGFLLSSMIFASILVFLIERDFLKAAIWTGIAALFSAVGLIHAYTLTEQGLQNKFGILAAPEFVVAYLAILIFFIGIHWYKTKTQKP